MKDCCKANRSPIVISTISGEPIVISSPVYYGELKGTYCPVCGEVEFNTNTPLEEKIK